MLHAINKLSLSCAIFAMFLCSCGNNDKAGADALLAESQTAISNRQFAEAITLLDTLNARYPKQTAERRQGLQLRASAMEGLAMDSIAAGDQILATASMELERISPNFHHVAGPAGLEGYWLHKKAPESIMGSTTVQGRVSDEGYFYIVANVQGRSIGLSTITISDGGEYVTSESISPIRVVKVEGSETASFSPEEVAKIGAWLEAHPNATKLTINGSKGKADVKFTAALRSQLLQTYQYSRAMQDKHRATVHREKYERMLAAARDQLANLTPVPEQ